jgi:chemotaxis protein CheX
MPFDPSDVSAIVETVWTTVLDWPVQPAAAAAPAGGPCVVGSVRLRGAWDGTVVVECPAELARRAAAVMFGVEPHAVSTEQARDALGELTNMVAGNLKALLPAPSSLSLPTVREGSAAGGGTPLLRLDFECEGGPFAVGIVPDG